MVGRMSLGQFIQQNPPVSRTGSVSTVTPKSKVEKIETRDAQLDSSRARSESAGINLSRSARL